MSEFEMTWHIGERRADWLWEFWDIMFQQKAGSLISQRIFMKKIVEFVEDVVDDNNIKFIF